MRYLTIIVILFLLTQCSKLNKNETEYDRITSNYSNFGDWFQKSTLLWRLKIENKSDTVDCFIRQRDGVIYIVVIEQAMECIKEIPFISLNKLDTLEYFDNDCGGLPDSFEFISSATIAIDTIDDEVFYKIEQILGESETTVSDKEKRLYRKFVISNKKGVVEFFSKKDDDANYLFWIY